MPRRPGGAAVSRATGKDFAPQPPHQDQIDDQGDAMGPDDETVMKRQELDLHQQQQQHRRDD
jgi:hypothetical protein